VGAKIFPRKAEALVVSLSKAANWDDDVSPRTDQRARVFVLRKVAASRGPEFALIVQLTPVGATIYSVTPAMAHKLLSHLFHLHPLPCS